MGRKVHPTGFRIGIIQDWQAKWYAEKNFSEFLREDLKLRQAIQSGYPDAGISRVEIERQAQKISVTIQTSRPGIVIGRGGQRVDEMRAYLESLIGKRIQLNIQEIRQPELDAYLVARAIAEQLEHRISYRRAMKQAIFRTMQAGAKGVKVNCAGRLAGTEIARREKMFDGQVPLHTIRADIDYGFTEACTTLGRIGVKVWIYKGDILPEVKEEIPAESLAAGAVGVPPAEPRAATAELEVEPGKTMEPSAEIEEKVAEPVEEKTTEAAPAAELEVEPGKTMEPSAEIEEKVAEPVEEKTTEAAPAASVSVKEEESKPEKEKDVTTQAGEVSQDS